MCPALNLLARKPLRPGALDVFARRDPMGTGFVCRVDLFDSLRELGVSGVPPQQASDRHSSANRCSVYVRPYLSSVVALRLTGEPANQHPSCKRSFPALAAVV